MTPRAALFVALSGALFGFGLALSTMVRPEIVISFLLWRDMGLLLVLGGAVVVTFAAYHGLPRIMRKPWARRAPNPAMKPPATRRLAGISVTDGSPHRRSQANARAMSPAAYTRRHAREERKRASRKYGACEKNDQTVVNTVLMPPMRPVPAKSRLMPTPITRPPAR